MPKQQAKAEVETEGIVGAGLGSKGIALRYRLGLYDPTTGKFVRWEGPVFPDSPYDREVARLTIEEFNELTESNPLAKLCMAAFPWSGSCGHSRLHS